MINMRIKKIRTASVNERGQIVLRKESEVIRAIEDQSWDALSGLAMKDAWGKEDEVWDKLAKNAKAPRL